MTEPVSSVPSTLMPEQLCSIQDITEGPGKRVQSRNFRVYLLQPHLPSQEDYCVYVILLPECMRIKPQTFSLYSSYIPGFIEWRLGHGPFSLLVSCEQHSYSRDRIFESELAHACLILF